MKANTEIICGDCLDQLKNLKDSSIDLVVTSPPYADQRQKTYGGIHPDKYVEWFLPISEQLYRVLKPSGSFVLNIKEKVVDGQRHTYVIELILALKKQGWLWTEEYVWSKKNSPPGFWPNRFRDAWERCLHFTKSKKFAMYQDEVKIPVGDWAKVRLKNLSSNDQTRQASQTDSGFARKIANWVGKDMVLPTNVLHLATECGNKKHSAAFPESLPTFFIKLLSRENDLVLDPFCGSGTVNKVCQKMGRRSIGIEINREYCDTLNKLFNTDEETKCLK